MQTVLAVVTLVATLLTGTMLGYGFIVDRQSGDQPFTWQQSRTGAARWVVAVGAVVAFGSILLNGPFLTLAALVLGMVVGAIVRFVRPGGA